MGLANFVAFLLLKILYNLVSMHITADLGKTLKNVQGDLTFIFEVLSESPICFVSFLVFLAVENVVSFTKTCLYRKRGSVTMRKYVKTFDVNIGHNLA